MIRNAWLFQSIVGFHVYTASDSFARTLMLRYMFSSIQE
ncbi:hypothetical protein VPMS16_112 [Vibrio sp. 16]|nr:hypothetical protein VPMS16_112 [Vibrio sp. 16]